MNPKIGKLKTEKEKNLRKIAELTARNEAIDAQVMELENTDIIGLVRENNITPEMLAELIRAALKNPVPAVEMEVANETE